MADRRRRRPLPRLPRAYAASFSGFYFGLIIVLWLLVGRALGLELRHQIDHPLWRSACDTVLQLCSAALAVMFIVGMLTTMAAGLYPSIVPAHQHRPYGMTIYNAASSHHALVVGLRQWSLGIALALGYFILAYRFFFAKPPTPGPAATD